MPFLIQFATVALIHLLAVMSPGPDFTLITATSLTRSRRSALWAAVGLALGIALHVSYSLLGIGFIISQSIILFSLIKFLGAGYLIFIGWKGLRAKPHVDGDIAKQARPELTPAAAVKLGFLTNALNPKATIFFVSVFAQIIGPSTPLAIKALYGIEMSLMTFVWFAFVATLFSHAYIKAKVRSLQHVIERITGAVLILFGLRLAFAKQH